MSIFFIISISLVVLGALLCFISWRYDSVIAFAFAGFCAIGALILVGVGATVDQGNYNHETVRICTEKGGVVSKDNHCFVNGKPVEFSPGVWQRN
jgi:hypothetical protein